MALGPIQLGGEAVLVLCFDPRLDRAISVVDAGPAVWVTDGPRPVVDGLEPQVVVRPRDLLRLRADPRVSALAPTQVIVHTLFGANPAWILAAIRHGGRTFHLVQSPGSYFTVNHRGAAVLCSLRVARRGLARAPGAARLERRLSVRIDPPFPSLEDTLKAAERVAELAEAQDGSADRSADRSRIRRSARSGPLRITHLIGALGPGGSERQLTYLARASALAGHRVRVVTAYPLVGDEGHYAPTLRAAGVPITSLSPHPWGQRFPPAPGISEALAKNFEAHLERWTLIPLVRELLADPPDVLHCWLDGCNTLGAVAGLAAGVPRIVLSARGLSPRRMPRLDRPYMVGTYARVARSRRVRLLANSRAGAADYADWTGIDPGRFSVIPNGLDAAAFSPLGEAQRTATRRELGVAPDAFLVVGVLRLSEEKAPFVFLQAVALARVRIPGLQAIHVGVGPLESQVHRRARELGLEGTLRFLGRLADPRQALGAADASALTSRCEGCPNVLLESQALCVPPVLTRAGGAPETVDDGRTAFVVEVGDAQGMAQRLVELAEDRERRLAFGREGRERVRSEFSLEAMVSKTLALYGDD